MAYTNRNQWNDRYQTGPEKRDNQFDRSRDDYSSNYGTTGSRYGGEDYRSEAPYRNEYDSDSLYHRNERRDDYSNLDNSRNRSSNMGSGYDPYKYDQTVGSFNQGKEGSYRSRMGNDAYRSANDEYDKRGSGYDSEYNRSYGRRNLDTYTDRSNNWNDRSGERNRYSSDNRYDTANRDNRDWWDRATDEVASWFGDDGAQRRREVDKRMGPHKGKGPKGYQRSDERIKDDINDRLSDDSFIDASEIDVTVEHCEVVLTGTVDTREEKRRAEDIAERISGVKNVENRLKVKSKENTGGATIYRDRDY